MKKIGNSGSTIVEAAVVMPIVIMAIISVVLMGVFLIYSTFFQVSLHWELIDKEGVKSKTKNIYQEDKRVYEISKDFTNGKQYFYTEQNFETKGGVLLPNMLKGNIDGRIYVINEKETIRYFDFFKN